MKYSLLFFCLILCSCEYSDPAGGCIPITPRGFSFNSQEGIDSISAYDSWWHFTGVQKEEGCEVKPETIECSWFSVVKKENSVFASVKQNSTDQKRYEYVSIKGNGGPGECSDVWGSFTITQCPEPIDIKLSKEELLFSAEGGIDSVIVTTYRNSWLDRPLIGVQYENIHYHYIYQKDFDFSDYDPWFNINIIDGNKVIFSVSENESGKERNSIITIDPNNCGRDIKVIQSAE